VLRYVAVIGPAEATDEQCAHAREAAAELAAAGAVIVTGGLGGVMGAAAAGAASVGGTSLGLLPDTDRARAHPELTVTVPTGLGELRNGLVVRSAHCVLAVGGSWGTLSEVALAVRTGVPVVSLGGWPLPADAGEAVVVVTDPAGAVAAVRRALSAQG
jgi:uncharacterized protein (TIGR00725 family)